MPARSTGKKTTKRYTRSYLEGLENEELYALAKPHRILPGRGRGRSTIINELLAKTGSEDAAPAKKTAAKKAPAQKAAAAKKTTSSSTRTGNRAGERARTGRAATRTTTTAKRRTTTPKKAPASRTQTEPTERRAASAENLLGKREVRAVARAFRTASDNFAKAADALEAALEG